MSKYRAQIDSLRKRIPRPKEQIHIVTEFSDGKRALGMGRGNLLTEDEYSKLRGKVILIEWGLPYDQSAEIEERPCDSGGNKESEERTFPTAGGIVEESESPEFGALLDRIRARRGETRDDDGAHAETMP